MESNQRSSQSFCARPGCGLAHSAHGFLPAACGSYIAPTGRDLSDDEEVTQVTARPVALKVVRE